MNKLRPSALCLLLSLSTLGACTATSSDDIVDVIDIGPSAKADGAVDFSFRLLGELPYGHYRIRCNQLFSCNVTVFVDIDDSTRYAPLVKADANPEAPLDVHVLDLSVGPKTTAVVARTDGNITRNTSHLEGRGDQEFLTVLKLADELKGTALQDVSGTISVSWK